jgi:hypothetical protein
MDLLIEKGWKKYYSCMCNGSYKEYWSNTMYPEYEIRIRPAKKTFTLFQSNNLIYGPQYLYKLEQTLIDYGIAG